MGEGALVEGRGRKREGRGRGYPVVAVGGDFEDEERKEGRAVLEDEVEREFGDPLRVDGGEEADGDVVVRFDHCSRRARSATLFLPPHCHTHRASNRRGNTYRQDSETLCPTSHPPQLHRATSRPTPPPRQTARLPRSTHARRSPSDSPTARGRLGQVLGTAPRRAEGGARCW